MEKVLNQEEIDEMFRAAQGGAENKPEADHAQVSPCHFQQAGQIGAEQVHAISTLHEVFARNLTHWLAAYLRTAFECNLVSVEQIPYKEVLSRLPEVAYLASFRLEPGASLGALQLDLALAFPIIDVLLGGQGRSETAIRDVTEIEEEILEGVVRIICRELQTAWQPIGLEFVFDQRQHAAQMQRLMSPDEMTLSLSFEIRMPDVRGTLNLVFPSVVSTALLRKLAREWAYQKPHGGPEESARIKESVMDCEFDVEVGITDIPIAVRDLVQLEPGTVLSLRKPVTSPGTLLVSGRQVFTAAVARQGSMRAGKICDPILLQEAEEGGERL